MTNDDQPPTSAIQAMVGSARLHLHNIPIDIHLFRRTLGWRPRLLRGWAREIVELAAELGPQLVRCHGAHLNALAASEIKRLEGVPYVLSMHTNPDENRRRAKSSDHGLRQRLQLRASETLERAGISHADCVVCVYRFIEAYAERMGAPRIEVIYNVVNGANLREKADYTLASPPRVIVPGRQFAGKDPRPVVEAVAAVPGIRCAFVGDGALHDAVVELARRLGISDRCDFRRAVPNDELCRSLRDYDILVSVNDYGGVSKMELEAALVGMPIVTNAHPLEEAPEVLGDSCLMVAGDADSYAEALERLISDEPLRVALGTGVRQNASEVQPELMEERYVALYRDLLADVRVR